MALTNVEVWYAQLFCRAANAVLNPRIFYNFDIEKN